jgi:menaquinone-dependent protoporphyrinogen oxidase
LNGHPSAFFSVSLAAAAASPDERAAAAQLARAFSSAGGWHPDETVCVAGRLAYTQYGVLTRFLMKRIARRHGAPTDTSRDHEFTNWQDVTRLADRIARRVAADRAPRAA